MVKKFAIRPSDQRIMVTHGRQRASRQHERFTTMAAATRKPPAQTGQSASATDAIGQALAALPADQLAALLAKAGIAQQAAPAAPAPRQAPRPAVTNDPSPAEVAAAMANVVGSLKSRGARGHGGDPFKTGSRGYYGVAKVTVNGVAMSVTMSAVINHSKPAG